MTRSKSFPKQCVKSGNGESRNWVMLMENNILSDDTDDGSNNKTPDIVRLRHPRTGTGAMFFFSADNLTVQEVFSFSGKKKSWFIDDSVKEDGRLYLSTPVDPCFLVLPYLKKAKEDGKVIPLDDLLIDGLYPETSRLLKCSAVKNIHMLADKKGDEDLNAWMYNEEKIMKWLSKKTERVAKVLREKNVQIKGAVSDNFVRSAREEALDQDKELYLSYACGLVSEYLSDDLSEKLLMHLNLPGETTAECRGAGKRKSCGENVENVVVKKVKTESHAMDLSKSDKHGRQMLPAKARSLMKASSGSKTITSFFKRK